MRIIRGYSLTQASTGIALTIGNFDGVHLGHQKLIYNSLRLAKERNLLSAIMTFEPNPLKLFDPHVPPFSILSFHSKLSLLKRTGIDLLFLVKFSTDFANISREEFVKNILISKMQVKELVVGYDFSFGRGKAGDKVFLRTEMEQQGLHLTEVAPVTGPNNLICSSSTIRTLLQQGKVKQASQLLGYEYFIEGKVQAGRQLARTLGFPTANIRLGKLLRPKYGVYAVKISIEEDQKLYYGMANLGVRPTLDGSKELLEVNIFNFDQDLYYKRIKVFFVDYIREEQKFAGIDQLRAQINQDYQLISKLYE
jgi:riboflavin kinase/FMN adenylyltransferase